MRPPLNIAIPILLAFDLFCYARHWGSRPATVQNVATIESNATDNTSITTAPVVTSNPLRISIINNLSGNGTLLANGSVLYDGSLKAYITGRDSANALIFLTPSGSWYYPNPQGSKTPIPVQEDVALPLSRFEKTTTFTLPDYITAARVWVANGSLSFSTVEAKGTQLVEPSFQNLNDSSSTIDWGYIELSYNKDGIWANIAFVDFVSLVMGLRLTLGSGQVQTVEGLKPGAMATICKDLVKQSAVDGQPWDNLCITNSEGSPLRVLSPNIYVQLYPGSMNKYFESFIDKVWALYAYQNLTIDTQSDYGRVACRVSNNSLLYCEGDNRSYSKPSAQEIFGCNMGVFSITPDDNDIHRAVVPRLCAAFNRGTLLQTGGDVQPSLSSDRYYQTNPANHYSRIIHKHEVDGVGYAFSYDDVNPSGENEGGVIAGPNPQLLEIVVGGFS